MDPASAAAESGVSVGVGGGEAGPRLDGDGGSRCASDGRGAGGSRTGSDFIQDIILEQREILCHRLGFVVV